MGTIDYSVLLERDYREIPRDYSQIEEGGFEHYCFACSSKNPFSMHLRFFYKPGESEVVTVYKLRKEYCGFPLFSHGGIIATLLDEVIAYASYHELKAFGVTKSMNIQYKQPVYVEKPIFLRARVVHAVEKGGRVEVAAEGSIHAGDNSDGTICAKATAILVILPSESFKDTFINGA
ncbi:MAG: PaaI family thioesterase [Promethearchaeota archaeon]